MPEGTGLDAQGQPTTDPAQILEGVLLRAALTDEMEHYLTLLETNVDAPLPDVSNLTAYRRSLDGSDTVPSWLADFEPGFHSAHFEGERLFMLYPPDPRTEKATMREGMLCQQEGITINLFLIPSWSQSEEDIRFAHRLAETTKGRVFFTAGKDLDRYVVWDYIDRKREIIG